MSRPTTMKKPWLYERPSYPSTSRMRRSCNADTLNPPITTYSCAPPSPGKKGRRVRPILRPLITNVASFVDADRRSPIIESSPISEGDGSDIYAEGYTISDHGDLPSPEFISPYVSVAAEAHILKTRRRKAKKGKGSQSANSSFSGLEGDSMFGDRKEEEKPALILDTKTGKDLEGMHFPSPLHKRQFTHPNQPIKLDKLQDLLEFLDIRDLPPTPDTAVAPSLEDSKLKAEPTLVDPTTNGSDSETDVENDISDTETVVDSAPPDVTKFKLDSNPLSPATTSLPRPLERSDSASSSDGDSPTRAFRSLVSFFHTSPRLRPPMPDKAKFISKTLKLGEYSRFRPLKTTPKRKGEEVDCSGDMSDSDSANGTPVFRRTLGPVFVSSPRAPKRKPLPVW